MIELLPEIRNTPRALITKNDKVLLLKKRSDDNNIYYSLPGGGQECNETVQDTLHRECLEEIDTGVEIGELILVTDYFKLRESKPPTRRHLLELVFACKVSENYVPRNGKHPDKHQTDVVWIESTEICSYPMYPRYLVDYYNNHEMQMANLYLGSYKD